MMPNKELEPLQLPESVVFIEVIFFMLRDTALTHLFADVGVCGIFLFHVKPCSQVRYPQARQESLKLSIAPTVSQKETQQPEKQGREVY